MADAIVHETVIKEKMTELANVTTQAEARINSQILSSGARDMLEYLGQDDYDAYILAFDAYDVETFAAFDAVSFDALNDDERYVRNLIYAEAYFSLYYLAISLKKLVKGAVNTTRDSAGGANIYAAPFEDIIANADNYRDLAFKCLGFPNPDEEETDDPLYTEGQFGVFVS